MTLIIFIYTVFLFSASKQVNAYFKHRGSNFMASLLQKFAVNTEIIPDRTIPSILTGDFAQSFVAQKNFILLEKFLNDPKGNLTDIATQYVNFCDGSFDMFIGERINSMETEEEKRNLGKIRYEINRARQKKLMEADGILRGILAAGGLKQMEAKLAYHLRRAEIDMAFMVILQLNIEDAVNAKADTAAKVMTHLETCITEHQDKIVSAPVRLMRLLVRTDDSNVRKQMLRQKLLLNPNLSCDPVLPQEVVEEDAQPAATSSPQCEHIVVQPVQSWGGADVTVQQLTDTIADVLSQMSDLGGEKETLTDLAAKCSVLLREVDEVLAEKDSAGIEVCENKAAQLQQPSHSQQ